MSQELDKLKTTLWDYYGQRNEIAAGIKIKPENIIEKPEALTRYEQIQDLNIPYVLGGLVDQPYLWMLQHGVIKNFLMEWAAVERALARATQQSR